MQNPDHQNAGIFVSYSITIITVLHVEKLAKGMNFVSQMKRHAISANFTEEQQIKINLTSNFNNKVGLLSVHAGDYEISKRGYKIYAKSLRGGGS